MKLLFVLRSVLLVANFLKILACQGRGLASSAHSAAVFKNDMRYRSWCVARLREVYMERIQLNRLDEGHNKWHHSFGDSDHLQKVCPKNSSRLRASGSVGRSMRLKRETQCIEDL